MRVSHCRAQKKSCEGTAGRMQCQGPTPLPFTIVTVAMPSPQLCSRACLRSVRFLAVQCLL